ncbi:MAG: glycosyltransferase family 39 protein [Candidatus Binatia bacterium]|nr:glycosyltransferase family 39 protein [Candidatus Binatia bacterium]
MTRPDHSETTPSPIALWGLVVAVFLAETLLHSPAQRLLLLWPDATEYLLIGNSWAQGTGFVDPVQWYKIPEAGQVMPAFSVRAPLVPFMFGIAFWLGSSVLTIIHLHAVWSAFAVGLLALGASRVMRLPAAAAAALWVGVFPAWVQLSRVPMTETTAVACVALVAWSLRFASQSIGGAAFCAALTLIAWLTRPNLAGMAVAAFVAMMISARPRPTLRNVPAWAYLATFVFGFVVIREVTLAWTGYTPYSGYALLGRYLDSRAAEGFSLEPAAGLLELVLDRPADVAKRVGTLLFGMYRQLFSTDRFSWIGWLGAPGILWCLWGGRKYQVERRFLAFCALGFTAVTALTLGYWDGLRYPLLTAVTGALCGIALLDDLCEYAARALPAGVLARSMSLVPFGVTIAAIVVLGNPRHVIGPNFGWPLRDTQSLEPMLTPLDRSTQALCHEIPRNTFVTAHDPWRVSFWCGNPATAVPLDFNYPKVRRAFLSLRRPAYLVQVAGRQANRGRDLPRIVPIAETERMNLYRVIGVESPIEWTAPPPVGCAGRLPACLESVDR